MSSTRNNTILGRSAPGDSFLLFSWHPMNKNRIIEKRRHDLTTGKEETDFIIFILNKHLSWLCKRSKTKFFADQIFQTDSLSNQGWIIKVKNNKKIRKCFSIISLLDFGAVGFWHCSNTLVSVKKSSFSGNSGLNFLSILDFCFRLFFCINFEVYLTLYTLTHHGGSISFFAV